MFKYRFIFLFFIFVLVSCQEPHGFRYIKEIPSVTWLPDGKQIAFIYKNDYKKISIYTINTDGTNLKELFSFDLEDNEGDSDFPDRIQWSPDGESLLLTHHWSKSHFWKCKSDGSGCVKISTITNIDKCLGGRQIVGSYTQAFWSLNGNNVAYIVRESDGRCVGIVDKDGNNSKLISVPENLGIYWLPSNEEIIIGDYLINLNDKSDNLHKLDNNIWEILRGRIYIWLNSREILTAKYEENDSNKIKIYIYKYNFNSEKFSLENERLLYDLGIPNTYSKNFMISPDGKKIVYTIEEEGTSFYVMDIDGNNKNKILSTNDLPKGPPFAIMM